MIFCPMVRPKSPECEILAQNFADMGDKRGEYLAKCFADFRPSTSRKIIECFRGQHTGGGGNFTSFSWFSGPFFHAAEWAFSTLKLAPPWKEPPEAPLEKSGRKKLHEKSSTTSTSHETKFFHRETQGAWVRKAPDTFNFLKKNSRRLELSISKHTRHWRWGQGPGGVDPRFPAGLPFPVPEILEFVAFRDSGKFFQQFSRSFPGTFHENSCTDPGNSHSLLEFSDFWDTLWEQFGLSDQSALIDASLWRKPL